MFTLDLTLKIPHLLFFQKYVVLKRFIFVGGGGLFMVLGSQMIGFPGAGPLSCISSAFVANLSWKHRGWDDETVIFSHWILSILFNFILFYFISLAWIMLLLLFSSMCAETSSLPCILGVGVNTLNAEAKVCAYCHNKTKYAFPVTEY